MTFAWVRRDVIDIVYEQQIATHGGLSGLKDVNALEAALARPRHKLAYDSDADAADLAAAYAYGLARAHAFHDGNKRIAFLVSALFLRLNGVNFRPRQADVVITFRALAGDGARNLTEDDLADWFRKHIP